MKKRIGIVLLCLISVVALHYGIFYLRTHPLPGSTVDPPRIGVRYGEELKVVGCADSYWTTRYLFGSSSSIGDGPHPRDMIHIKTFEYDPSTVEQEAVVCFEKAPEEIRVYCVDISSEYVPEGDPCEVTLMEKEDRYAACYRAILKEGAQYYKIRASWKDGFATYWFRIVE